MLLHEHPVNAARERAGRPPANSVWFSGGGTLPPRAAPASSIRTFADDRHRRGARRARGVAGARAAGEPRRRARPTRGRCRRRRRARSRSRAGRDRAIRGPRPPRARSRRAGSRNVTLVADDAGDALMWRAPGRGSGNASPAASRATSSPRSSRPRADAMMEIVRRAVPDAARTLAAAGVHPVLARVFASRGVDRRRARRRSRLAAVVRDDEGHRRGRRAPRRRHRRARTDRDRRRLRRRRRDRVRGRRARARGDGRQRRFPRAEPLRVRLRTHAGDRRRGRGDGSRA